MRMKKILIWAVVIILAAAFASKILPIVYKIPIIGPLIAKISGQNLGGQAPA